MSQATTPFTLAIYVLADNYRYLPLQRLSRLGMFCSQMSGKLRFAIPVLLQLPGAVLRIPLNPLSPTPAGGNLLYINAH